MSSAVAAGLVPVHVGQWVPGSEQDQVLRLQLDHDRGRFGRSRLPRVPDGLDWQRLGLEPRWLGMDSSDCAVAVEPSFFDNHGAGELERFQAAARRRGELALVIAVIGDVESNSYNVFGFDSSVSVSKLFTSVDGRRLPVGGRPVIVQGLEPADRDLALRLLNRPSDAPWWALRLSGSHVEYGDGSGSADYEPEGQLHPILVDALGDPVVAAWTSASGGERWYIIPDATDWDSVLDWLINQALPEYVPNALRRVRSPHFVDPALQTADELNAQEALNELEARYTEEKQRIEQGLRDAQERAEPIRYGLLYGTGGELVRAVAAVLAAAGLRVIDLDDELGATRSADLLVGTDAQPWRLVEVKAAGGPASESLVGHLQRHLDTWPELRPEQPVAGGMLVVNHQHKLHPSERAAQVYSRPEFVATLPVSVLSAVELFRWWRTGNWAAIRTALLGADQPQVPAGGTRPPITADSEARQSRLRWLWPRGTRGQ